MAGHALGGTKEWTDTSKAAFAALLGRPIDQILDKADHDIRVRGPLWWTVGETAADARRGYPWVGLPSGGIHAMGNVQDDARGVLVIENADTFQQVCMHCPEVTDRWLCVWGKGSATSGVVAFLELMSDVPIAVWGDLDAHGIQIVTNLAERLKRDITPVAMTADLYAGGTKYKIQWRRKRGTGKHYVYTFIDDRPIRSLKDKLRALTPGHHSRTWDTC